MNCYLWELEALLEGLELKQLDLMDSNATFGFWLRYILNAKKPQRNKVFDKQKLEKKVRDTFNRENKRSGSEQTKKISKVIAALNHFRNR